MPDSSSHAAPSFRRAGRIVAAIAWMALIFAASSRPDLRVSSVDTLDFILRKCAHMAVFGVLAILLARAMAGEWRRRPVVLAAAWLAAVAYACSDEWHQTFVRGRVGHPSDVAIDALGALLALGSAAWLATRAPRTEPEARP
ncbi:MAG: VanZ family protein [Thermoleophilia bacterium]|nr:VanZ family protein [Thermoleophilia bacterium]